jgi:chromosome segregation ATPase
MDENQIARMIEWLDSERRRDKQTIVQLEEKSKQQQDQVDQLLRRLGGVESDQTGLRSAFLPVGRDVEVLDVMRNEWRHEVETIEVRRLAAERELERRADLVRETLSRPLRDLADRLDDVEKQTQAVAAMGSDRDRIASGFTSIQQRLDELEKVAADALHHATSSEEQRRLDFRRLSDVQSELPDIQRQLDSMKPKVERLEELTLYNEKRVLEMQNQERDRRDQLQQFIDQQLLMVQERDQKLEAMIHDMEQYDGAMQQYAERFGSWEESYRRMRQVIEDFDRLAERLDRRVSEVAESQRLSEERFRTEWNAWEQDDQKRWRSFTMGNDETWRMHDREFDSFRAQLGELRTALTPVLDSLDRIWKLQRAQADLFRERYGALLVEHDTIGDRVERVEKPRQTGPLGNGNGIPNTPTSGRAY